MDKKTPSRRERYWIVLGEDGRHITVGRHSNPSPGEITKAEDGLVVQGLSGWLAIMEGAYYERSNPSLMMVRPLGQPERAFADAEEAFLATRRTALKGLA